MATLKPTTVPAKRLAETISGASTTFKLNNIRSWAATATDLTSADFGSRLWAVFRNSAGTLMEIMEVDPATITAASSPITILYRGLSFDGTDITEVSANKLTWVKGDTIVELGTHVPQLLAQYVDKVQDQTIGGVKTFSSFPLKSGSTSPTQAAEFATKEYVDTSATGSSTYDQNTFTGTAGETLVATDLCYYKASDQRWWKADADAIATSIGVKLAVAQGGATAGNTLTMLGGGINKNFSGLTVTAPYFVSNTTGGISTTPGTYARFIGRAISATTLHFDPDNGNVVSKYGTEIYAADSVGTDAYAITTSSPFLALKDGMVVRFKAGTANTGAATLAVDGLTAKTIKKNFNVDLATNDIKVNQIVTVVYESTTDTWQMVSQVANTPSEYIADFGDGSDGNVTISSNTTLTKDMNYNNLTIDSTFNLITAGYRVYVKGTLTNNGTIHNNGSNASASTGGAGGLAGTLLGGAGGPNGGGGGGGGGGIVFISAYSVAVQGTIEAKGGNGGTPVSAANGNNAGTAGTAISRSLIQSGTSGAGGAAGGGPAGGGSAGITTSAKCSPASIPILTMMIEGILQLAGGASGGSGGSYVSTGNAGGGGGGMGGVVVFLYRTMTTSGTISVAGGAGGSFWVSGANGSAGSSGLSISLAI